MKHFILIVVSIFFVASSAIMSNAEQKGVSQKPGGQKPAETGKVVITPLQQPLTANMSAAPMLLCNVLPQRIASIQQLAHHDLQTMLSQQGDQPIIWPGVGDLYYHPSPSYKSSVESCCSSWKSFSVQDQQAAGCANSDTVKQCLDKLVKYCISKAERKDEIRARLQQSQAKASNISVKTQQLSEEIKQLLSIMP